MRRLLALLALVGILAQQAHALSSITVRKVYGKEVLTVSDFNADWTHVVNGINDVRAFFPGTDSLKIERGVFDSLHAKDSNYLNVVNRDTLWVQNLAVDTLYSRDGQDVYVAVDDTLRVVHLGAMSADVSVPVSDTLRAATLGALGTDLTFLAQDTLRLDNLAASSSGNKILVPATDTLQGAAAPANGNDLTNKTYVDAQVAAAGGGDVGWTWGGVANTTLATNNASVQTWFTLTSTNAEYLLISLRDETADITESAETAITVATYKGSSGTAGQTPGNREALEEVVAIETNNGWDAYAAIILEGNNTSGHTGAVQIVHNVSGGGNCEIWIDGEGDVTYRDDDSGATTDCAFIYFYK